MKKIIITAIIAIIAFSSIRCTDFPIDEDGLLVTGRSECYVSNFELLGSDHQTVRVGPAIIDTTELTINVVAVYGTDLKNLYPQFSLAQDAKLDPKITGKVDFSDLENPKRYTVVSGNRAVRKTYTVNISLQQKQ